ncbi:hypothetical protein JTB14_032159 [Gonioctena quinquepunctata]|nr:hypothetical protein JTB14_032159 [Gonioctena quinquepunctata]
MEKSKRESKFISTKRQPFRDDETEMKQSPKSVQKNDPQVSIKITQNEVEEKLKCMRLKRLSRLNNFTDPQHIYDEIGKEDSFKSDQGGNEYKPSVRGIVEEVITANEKPGELGKLQPITSEIQSEIIRNKPSSTKKFINKFNCAINDEDEDSSDENTAVEEDISFKSSLNEVGISRAIPSDISGENSARESGISSRKTIYFKENEKLLHDLHPSESSKVKYPTIISGETKTNEKCRSISREGEKVSFPISNGDARGGNDEIKKNILNKEPTLSGNIEHCIH